MNLDGDNFQLIRPPSATVDFYTPFRDDWDDADDIELDGDEHDLFLKKNHVNSNGVDATPFSKPISPIATSVANHSNGLVLTRHQQSPRTRSQIYTDNQNSDTNDDNHEAFELPSGSTIDQHHMSADDSADLPPIVYQVPNFQQFADNFEPLSHSSIIVSLIIITVILCVTILPIISLPPKHHHSQDLKDNVIANSSSPNSAQHKQPVEHADFRCKCICPPTPNQLTNNTVGNTTINQSSSDLNQRRLYVGNTSPNQCNCNNIVQPHLTDLKLHKNFCSSCECRYQSRNTTTIRRNVIFFITVLSVLGLYMFVQYLLRYFKITRRSLPGQLRWLSFQLNESGYNHK